MDIFADKRLNEEYLDVMQSEVESTSNMGTGTRQSHVYKSIETEEIEKIKRELRMGEEKQ